MRTWLGTVPGKVYSACVAASPLARGSVTALALIAVAGCAATPETKTTTKRSKIDSKWGVEAPKKMIADGDPVPPGGGRYQVGKPYMVGGRMYYPREDPNYDRTGTASWYGSDFHGRETANGEVYDKDSLSAAHTTLPIPSYARVTNLDNGRSVLVRVNDRGPYVGDRLIDVSERTADLLGFKGKGLSRVRVQYVSRAPVEGSDQKMLVASLRGPGLSPSVAQDRTLIAQNDRSPSDGRVTGLAAERIASLSPAAEPAKARPVMLAAATEDLDTRRSAPTTSYASAPRPLSPPKAAPPPFPGAPLAQQPSTAPKPGVLGTLPAAAKDRSPALGQLATIRKPTSNSDAGILDALPPDHGTPLDLGPPASADKAAVSSKPLAAPSGPGTIRKAAAPASPVAVLPSRYGPNGTTTYPQKTARPEPEEDFYTANRAETPAVDAISRLIDGTLPVRRAHLDLGAYANPATAARVAELMRPYGDVSMAPARSGLGERMTVVSLAVAPGMIAGTVLAEAEALGIRDAMIRD